MEQLEKPTSYHWLREVASSAGLPDSETLLLPDGLSTSEAWAIACRTCGVKPDELAARVAKHFGLAVAEFSTASHLASRLLPEKTARQLHIAPIREDDRTFWVATADPTDFEVEQDAAFASGRAVTFEIASPEAVNDAIDQAYAGITGLMQGMDADELTNAVQVVQDMAPADVDQEEVEAAPVVRLANLILRDAVRQRVSDIHLEPGRLVGTVRFRIDGIMRTHLEMPIVAMHRIVSRIKVMGKLDIADRLRPQDGRARIAVDGKLIDMRISTVPTRDAEKAVLRLLAQAGSHGMEQLQLLPRDEARIRTAIGHPNGIVIVTGPTGSGKTTTLYSILRELATGEVNIMTVEDPIEYDLPNITQIQVETKRNVTFPSALRAILRQDPDIILVGEIRDLETARVAVQAAMTGHLVLATLHTNDAASSIARLADLGVDYPSIASTLRGVLAQRLVRRVCKQCAQRIAGVLTPHEHELALRYGIEPVVRVDGCPQCTRSGYQGRFPVLEVLPVSTEMVNAIAVGRPTLEIQKIAAAGGMQSMLQNALERVALGETTLDEIERVLGDTVVTAAGTPASGTAGSGAESTSTPAGSATPSAASPRARNGSVPKGKNGIPATEPEAPGEASSTDTPKLEAGAVEPAYVLVVDDDPVYRATARRSLERLGYVVEEAAGGVAAVQKLSVRSTFALILSDLHMPDMNGKDLLACVRAMPKTARVPVIIATSEDDADIEGELIEAGATDYIRKPLDPARFAARVRAAIRRGVQ